MQLITVRIDKPDDDQLRPRPDALHQVGRGHPRSAGRGRARHQVRAGLLRSLRQVPGPLVRHGPGHDRTRPEERRRLGAGHSFIVFLGDGFFPLNVLNTLKMVPEVCRIFCATANPTEVVLAETEQGRGVLGVVDGFSPEGRRGDEDIAWRRPAAPDRLQALRSQSMKNPAVAIRVCTALRLASPSQSGRLITRCNRANVADRDQTDRGMCHTAIPRSAFRFLARVRSQTARTHRLSHSGPLDGELRSEMPALRTSQSLADIFRSGGPAHALCNVVQLRDREAAALAAHDINGATALGEIADGSRSRGTLCGHGVSGRNAFTHS